MSMDFSVSGADDFLRLSKALKAAGETDIRKALHKGLRDGANKAKPDAAERLAADLPSRLRARGLAVKQAVVVKTGNDPGVSVVVRYGKSGNGLSASNAQRVNREGVFRHPVWDDNVGAEVWVDQQAHESGWFDDTWTSKAPALRNDLAAVLEQVANDIVRKAR